MRFEIWLGSWFVGGFIQVENQLEPKQFARFGVRFRMGFGVWRPG